MTEPVAVLEIQPFDFQAGVFDSFEAYHEYFAERQIDPVRVEGANAAASVFHDAGKAWFSIIIPEGIGIAKIVHEVSHLADFAMEEAGVPCSYENTEIRGYVMERLMEQLDERR